MTYRRQIGTLLLVGGVLVHGPAGVSTSAAELCAASQLNQAAR